MNTRVYVVYRYRDYRKENSGEVFGAYMYEDEAIKAMEKEANKEMKRMQIDESIRLKDGDHYCGKKEKFIDGIMIGDYNDAEYYIVSQVIYYD